MGTAMLALARFEAAVERAVVRGGTVQALSATVGPFAGQFACYSAREVYVAPTARAAVTEWHRRLAAEVAAANAWAMR
jgi:hypothetical protein